MNVFLIAFTSFCLITNVVYAVFSLLSRQITFLTSQILLLILVYFVKLLTFKTFLIFSLFLSGQIPRQSMSQKRISLTMHKNQE